MGRKYVKKHPERIRDAEVMRQAVEAVSTHRMSFREAEKKFGISRSAIFNRIKGRKTNLDVTHSGRKTALSAKEEHQLVLIIKARAKFGYPVDKTELYDIVQQYVQKNNIKTPFKNSRPGQEWYTSFMKRYPTLSLKSAELREKQRKSACDPFTVYDMYEKYKTTLNEELLTNSPELIFNLDECGFLTDPTRVKCIGEKGKALWRLTGGSGREHISVLACVSASGAFMPPFVIFRGAAVQPRWVCQDDYPGTLYSCSSKGWMEEAVFEQWFQNAYIPTVNKTREESNQKEKKAILIYDGHASHMNFNIIDAAIRNNIIILRLPSHLTDKCQPLDVSVFGPLKTEWEKILVIHGRESLGAGTPKLSKSKFSELLGKLWHKINPQNIRSGFMKTGFFPYNRSKFPISNFPPDQYRRYLTFQEPSTTLASPASKHTATTCELAATTSELAVTSENTSSNLQSVEDASMPSTSQKNPSNDSNNSTSVSVIESFLENMTASQKPAKKNRPTETNVRLKRLKYGEILTTEQVLQREKVAQTKKNAKNIPSKTKRELNNKSKPKSFSKKTQKDRNKEAEEMSEASSESISEHSETDSDCLTLDQEQNVNPEYKTPNVKDIKPGTYLLVNFIGGKRNKTTYTYVCVAESEVEENGGEVKVLCLRCTDKGQKKFKPDEGDVSYVDFDQIKAILPLPKVEMVGERTFYVFPFSMDIFEMN